MTTLYHYRELRMRKSFKNEYYLTLPRHGIDHWHRIIDGSWMVLSDSHLKVVRGWQQWSRRLPAEAMPAVVKVSRLKYHLGGRRKFERLVIVSGRYRAAAVPL